MKKVIVIETAEELLSMADHPIAEGSEEVVLPPGATLLFENDMTVGLRNAPGFELLHTVRGVDVIRALAERAGFKVHIT